MKVSLYEVYRDGHGDVRDRIKTAVREFYRRHNALPVEIVVHKTLVEQAQAALDSNLPVRGSGGCLKPEVWLGVGDD